MPHHSFQWASTELCTELQQYYFVKSAQIAKKSECDTWESFTTTKNKMNDGEKEEFFLEIDFKYPKKHHINHSDFPLAPNNFCIQNSDLSTKASELLNDLNPNQKTYKSEKLTTTLYGLNNYIVHSAILDFYVSQGLEVKKVHKAVRFVSSKFLEPWILHCTNMRKECVSKNDSAGKIFWKLMINR